MAQLVKNPPVNAGDTGLIPGLGRCPGEGNGNPLQYSCLGNPMDGRVWRAIAHGVTKSRWGHKESGTMERVTLFTFTFHRRHSQQDRAAICMRWSVEEKISTVTPRALTLVDWVEDSGVCCVGYIQYLYRVCLVLIWDIVSA